MRGRAQPNLLASLACQGFSRVVGGSFISRPSTPPQPRLAHSNNNHRHTHHHTRNTPLQANRITPEPDHQGTTDLHHNNSQRSPSTRVFYVRFNRKPQVLRYVLRLASRAAAAAAAGSVASHTLTLLLLGMCAVEFILCARRRQQEIGWGRG